MTTTTATEQRLDEFIKVILSSSEIVDVASRTGQSEADKLLASYTNEARVGLKLVEPLLRPGLRLLEVGCGIGALSKFLLDSGYTVTGIEPAASGFGFMREIGSAIARLEPARRDAGWIPIGAEALNARDHGTFDLIFSTNVLEHVSDLEGAFRGMSSVLAPGGWMVHLCPNYVIPFEPHFGIPLLPFAPGATQHLFPKTVARYPGLWEGLNFITSRRVKKLARSHGLDVRFDRGLLAETFARFETDPTFRERQGTIASAVHRVVSKTGLLAGLNALPGEYVTPMIMRLERSRAVNTAAKGGTS